MKKDVRKELTLGIILGVLWLLLKILPRSGFLMTLLLIAAIALVVVGLVPENIYAKVKDTVTGIIGRKK